jgi:hypothetical protein
MKFKYIKEYKNFQEPLEKSGVEEIINKKNPSRKEMEEELIKVNGFDQSDLDEFSDKAIEDLFDASKEDLEDDEEDDEEEKEDNKEIDPDLREKK